MSVIRFQAQRMAHMQMEVEKHPKKKSPIAEIVSLVVIEQKSFNFVVYTLCLNKDTTFYYNVGKIN